MTSRPVLHAGGSPRTRGAWRLPALLVPRRQRPGLRRLPLALFHPWSSAHRPTAQHVHQRLAAALV